MWLSQPSLGVFATPETCTRSELIFRFLQVSQNKVDSPNLCTENLVHTKDNIVLLHW